METFQTVAFLLIGGLILWYIYLFIRGSIYVANDTVFKQAGVIVNFQQGTITLGSRQFKVNQVTGISRRAFTSSHKHGDSQIKRVTIDIDDFKKPHHTVTFFTRGQADQFMQRLSVALRKAGGPSFV